MRMIWVMVIKGAMVSKKSNTPISMLLAKMHAIYKTLLKCSGMCAGQVYAAHSGKHSGHSYIRGNYELGGYADSTDRGPNALHGKKCYDTFLLKQNGYATAMIGKWGLGMQNTTGNPLKQGF